MTTTVYIDANRTNASVKSSDNKNEWTYKLSTPLSIPSGSEIAVQDSFIHKKGINGASIEIDEDIEEEVNFFYYLSDNPHFVAGSVFGGGQINSTPQGYNASFYPCGALYTTTEDMNDPNAGTGLTGSGTPTIGNLSTEPNVYQYGKPLPSQRREFFSYKDTQGSFTIKPSCSGGARNIEVNTLRPFLTMSDPYLMGYSEMPMMAVQVGDIELYDVATDTFDVDEGDAFISRNQDTNFKSDFTLYADNNSSTVNENDPTVYNVPNDLLKDIAPPYSLTHRGIGELSIMDKLLRPKTGRVKIFIPKGVYSVNEIAQMIDDYFNGRLIAKDVKEKNNFNININKKNLENQEFNGQVSTDNTFTTEDLGTGIFTKCDPLRRYGTVEIDKQEYNSTTYPLGDVRNDPYSLSPLRIKGIPSGVPPATDTRVNKSVNLFPSTKQTLYVPVHRFNDIVKMTKYGRNSKYYGTQTTYNPTNSGLKKPDNRLESFAVNRWGFQIESANKCGHRYGDDPRQQNPLVNDITQSTKGRVIGLHCKVDVSTYPAQQKNSASADSDNGGLFYSTTGIYADNYSFNPMRNGYYLGTPDFSFTYDGNESAFKINGLHQSCRIPSVDMVGNTMTDSGNAVAYLKRPADCYATNQSKQFIFGTSNTQDENDPSKALTNLPHAKKLLRGASNPEERIGGIAVHNWALNVARKLGDVDFNKEDENSKDWGSKRFRGEEVMTEDFLESPEKYIQCYSFRDFFTTEEKARKAWETTLWYRLGFSYDALQNPNTYEPVSYYNMDKEKEAFETSLQAPKIHTSLGASEGVINPDYFKMPGITTRSQLDISLVPQISTTFNTKSFNAVLQQRYEHTDNKMSEIGKVAGSRRGLNIPSGQVGDTLFRMYDNHDVNNVYYPYSQNYNIFDFRNSFTSFRKLLITNASSADYGDTTLMYDNSMYRAVSRGVVETAGNPIVAQGLPSLSKHGYYIITSDIVDNSIDDLKQGQPLPLLGVVPISNLSNQDFITSKNTITHITNQQKVINKIRIKILNPDLTEPLLEDNSSVLLAITMPLPQETPVQPNLDSEQDRQDEEKK